MKNLSQFINSANTPQNTGGGTSHSSTVVTPVWKGSRPTVSRRSTDSQPKEHRTHTLLCKALKYAAMILMILTFGVGQICGSVAVTWTASQTDFNNTFNSGTAATRLAGLAVGSGTRAFTVYTTSALANSNAAPSLTWNNTNYFVAGDNNYKKAGIAIKLPSDCDDVDSICFYVKTTNSRKIYYEANVASVSSSNPSNTFTLTTSFAGYKMGSTYTKGRYFAVGGRSGGSGDNAIQKVIVYFHESVSCASNPADPTEFAVGSITADGGTFTITDGANTNNYEIVCKTTTGAPASDATPTKTGTAKTLAVTGLNDGTTYYAWVRSVCDASHKSDWVALGDGGTFTTKSCSISSCGNAYLTYAINASTSVTNTAENLLSNEDTEASNNTALGISSTASLSTIGISSSSNAGKAAAKASPCYPTAPTMSSKISMYNGSSYSSSNYLQFTFTVKDGYTFTPCDIRFVVQPVSATGYFRWEVTDGTTSYGYGTGEAGVGSSAGATVLTGLSSTSEMAAGTYYIRLYPYYNGSNTFRISNDVILKGTTAEAVTPSCTATAEAGANKETTTGVGVAMAATAATSGYTGAWSIKAGSPSTDAGQLGTTSSNTMTFTPNNTGTYTLVWTVTDDNDGSCSATDEATVTVSAPTHGISYTNLKGSDVSSYPTTYTEGVGIASFDALADVTDYHFNGWSPSSISSSATTDQTISATWVDAYDVTFDAGDGGGTVPSSFQKWEDATFTLPGQGSMTAPSGYAFDGWNDGTNDYAEGATYTMGNAAVTLTAQWEEIPTYTISLDANGGSVASYDGWTKVSDVYSKTVEAGTEVSLLAFTKEDVQLMFFRDGSANEYSSSVTLNANLSLKAVWGEEKEVELYYWEGKSGGATERGGTASPMSGTEAGSEDVNYSQSTYYTLRLRGKADYSTNWIKIELDEGVAVKTGDEVKVTGYYSNSNTKQSAPLMKDVDGNTIFAETTTLPNIQQEEDPEERIYTVPANIDASVLKLTRNVDMTATNAFITKLVITGTRVIEVMDPAQAPTISAHPASASYTWKESVSALTVTASVTDGGTLHYQWYKAGETDTKVGSDANSYTPVESGTYYVVVTNKKTGYSDKSTTSNNATVTIGSRPSYTVTYKDGASSLGTESVQEDASPTGYAAKQTKSVYGISGLYEFDGWYNNSDLAGGHAIANIAALVVTKDTTIYGKWTRIEAASVDLVARAATIAGDESTTEELNACKTWLTGQGYVYNNLNALDNKSGNNGAYLGLKTKSTDAYVAFNVPADKRVTIKLGSMALAAEMYINGAKNESQALTGGSTSSGDNYADWIYDTDAASTFKLKMTTSGTCVVKAITIANKPAASDDVSLGSLTYQLGEADPVNIAIVPSQTTYNVALPYKTPLSPVAVIAATGNHNGTVGTITQPLSNTNGTATFTVTAEDGEHTANYTINLSIAPKDGASLIKVATTGGSNKTVTGFYAGDGDVNLSSNKKMDDGKYIGFTMEGMTLQTGDLINVHTTTAANTGGSHIIFYDNMTDKNELYETGEIGGTGNNIFTINAAMVGASTIYVYRSNADNAHKWNGYVDYLEATRVMNPMLTAITFDGSAGTIDEENKTVDVSLPYESDLENLTIVPTILRNAAHATTPETVTTNEGAWVLSANTYRIMDKDGDYTDYTINLTRALPAAETPVITTDLTDHEFCAGDEPELDATAEAVSDGGTVTYQWYDAEGAIDGATNAKYTPAGEGSYYCVLTNSLAEHTPASTTSATAVLTQKAATSISGDTEFEIEQGATVKFQPTITGSNPSYAWYACDAEGNHEGDALGTKASYTTATLNDLGTFYYVLEVTADCGSESQVFSVTVSDLGGSLVAHRPGNYYGQTLKEYDGRYYEIYGMSRISSKNYLWAGAPISSSSDENCVMNLETTTEISWMKNTLKEQGSQYSALSSKAQFTASSLSNTYSMKYSQTSNMLVLKVKGYDQFSMVSKDANTSNQYLQVFIDGEERERASKATTETVYDFSLTDGEHLIVVRPSTNNNNYIFQFSLRLPIVAKVDETNIVSVQDAIDAASDPITITMVGNSYEDIVIENGKDITIAGAGHTLNSITVENGGKVNASSALTVVDNLYLEAQAGASGQVLGATNVTAGAVYMDVKFFQGADNLDEETAGRWYMISAPFDVNLNGGFSLPDGTPMTFGTSDDANIFDLFVYDGAKRASTGVTGWKRAQGKMHAGRACLIGFNPGQATTIRLKAASTSLSDPSSITLNEYAGDDANQNWNGVANPTLHYTDLSCDVQTYNNEDGENGRKYIAYSASSTSFVVGTAFFVQATGTIDLSAASHSEFRAPQRQANERYEACVRIFRDEATEFADQMYVRASENASSEYEQGHDMITWNGTTANTAMIWANNYGKRLAIEEAPLVNDKASYALGIYAPKAGDYRIVTMSEDNADIYLTYEGSIIWNLSMGEYLLTLDKGNNNGYGLLLQKKAPMTPTGVENIESGVQGTTVQKVVIDNHVFILRAGQMYDVTGKMVK